MTADSVWSGLVNKRQKITSPPRAQSRRVKSIAFYLPQYHPIPENDLWWGPGFTEWTNVTRGRALFEQHDQPRRPGAMGYYDLRAPEVRKAQADLAREYGVHGFAYYFYWFDGKRLLNQPIEAMLKSGEPDFPFCICWANEHWSRNWDGQNRHVLMAQNYSMESCKAFIQDVIPFMQDERYIRHDGKPVLIIYRTTQIPNWRTVAKMWREECRKAGLGEIHLCAVRFGLEPLEGQPAAHGLDAYVLFPPHETVREDLRDQVRGLHPEFGGELFSYEAMAAGDVERFEDGYPWPVHRGATMAWDNTARRKFAARIFHGATPSRFRRWLREILRQEDAHNPSSESLVFLNAWNEWAEGTVLEPDERWGEGYLEAVRSALQGYCIDGPPDTEETDSAAAPVTGPHLRALQETIAYDPGVTRRWIEGAVEPMEDAPTIVLAAHISGHQLYGGERSLIDVLRALRASGRNVIVTLPSGNNADYIKTLSQDAVGLYILPYPQWRDDRAPVERLILEFGEIFAAHGADALHANTITHLEALEAARRSGVVRVVHARELITMDTGLCEQIGKSPEDIIADVLRTCDYVIANSRATASIFSAPGRSFLAFNAIDASAFEPAAGPRPDAPLRFGVVSSNMEKKGVGDVVALARRLGERSDIELIVIGPERENTRAWAAEVEAGVLPSTLKFLGYRDTPQEAMAELDVLLSLSHFAESFGRTVAEAAACAKPAIGYHWGALPEVIDHEATGLLAPYRDIGAVAEAVETLAGDPERVARDGAAARARVTALFSQDALREALDDAYAAILADRTPREDARLADGAAIVVPIYNAFEDTRACIESLKAHTPGLKAVLVNDASSDPRIAELLEGLAGDDRFEVITNEENLGYTRSINRAVEHAAGRDIVLVNSDARVTPNWLDGMRAAARWSPEVGTVTAMGDNAGAFSFPQEGEANPRPHWVDEDGFARLVVQAAGACTPPMTPTGSGFCMFIKRALLDAIGSFDEEGFPRGYGEENDLCLRAIEAGWINLITPWTYIYHTRSASFGDEKAMLIKSGVDEVIKRYPDYVPRVKAAFSGDDMLALRNTVRQVYR
jgi:glycosyltransferase involved in cell wall biosynthesis/GT2 family glycosyltransferase